MDVTAATTSISEALTAGAAIGLAVCLLFVMLHTFRWLRRAMDDVPDMYEADDDELLDGELYAVCDACGINSIDDNELFDLAHSDSCPQCGDDLHIEDWR
jgi:hypothetical protein